MSESKGSDDFGKLVKTLGEIAGYVSTILPYLLAILGKGSIPYPTLVATLTFMVSVIILWRWRWPKITKMKSSVSGGKAQRRKTTGMQNLRDLFQAGTSQLYRMSLPRRRVETTLLSLFVCSALGLGIVNASSIQEEITGFHCLSDARGFRVVISDFSSEEHQFENNLANVMDLQSGQKFQICRYNKPVQLTDQAEKAGRKKGAGLLVWGNYSGEFANVYWTAIDWETPTPPPAKVPTSEGQEAAFLAENISAQVLFHQGEVGEAQKLMENALDTAEGQSWIQSNPTLLADGYFLLGLLFDPKYAPAGNANTRTAIDEYTLAIKTIEKWGLDLESAYRNRALLYYDEGNLEKAIKDYTVLIDKHTDDVNSMYLMRAQAYTDSGNCSLAIADMGQVLQNPDIETDVFYPYYIHSLGMAYLSCGDLTAAQDIYQKMPPLSEEDKEAFLGRLNDLAVSSGVPKLQETIHSIVDHIQQLPTE